MTRRISSRHVSLPVSFLLLAAGGLAACDVESDYEDGRFYCTDKSGTVVDEKYCDNNSSSYNSSYFIYSMGNSMHTPPRGHATYPVGSKLPSNSVKIPVSDSAARARFGLPATGKVSNGTVKTGVIGKGGVGSAVKGGGAKSGG